MFNCLFSQLHEQVNVDDVQIALFNPDQLQSHALAVLISRDVWNNQLRFQANFTSHPQEVSERNENVFIFRINMRGWNKLSKELHSWDGRWWSSRHICFFARLILGEHNGRSSTSSSSSWRRVVSASRHRTRACLVSFFCVLIPFLLFVVERNFSCFPDESRLASTFNLFTASTKKRAQQQLECEEFRRSTDYFFPAANSNARRVGWDLCAFAVLVSLLFYWFIETRSLRLHRLRLQSDSRRGFAP